MKKHLLSLFLLGTMLAEAVSVFALEFSSDQSDSSYLEVGVPVTLTATPSPGASSVDFFANGIAIGQGTETTPGSRIFQTVYTPTESGLQTFTAAETMMQGGIGSRAEWQMQALYPSITALKTDFNSATVGSVPESDTLWSWNIPSLKTIDSEHGLSLCPTQSIEWNVKGIHNHQTSDFIAEMDYYMPSDGVLQCKLVTSNGVSDQDVYLTPTTVETSVYDAELSTQRRWIKQSCTQAVGWHHLKVVTHLADRTKSIYIDGTLQYDRIALAGNTLKYLLSSGGYLQRFGVISSGNVCIDNLYLRLISPPTKVSDIQYTNGSVVITTEQTVPLSSAEDTIRLFRVGDCQKESVPVTISVNGTQVTVTPTIPLRQSSIYRLVIDSISATGDPVFDRSRIYSFTTPKGSDLVADGNFHLGRFPLTSAQGLKSGDTITFDATLYHAKSSELWVMLVAYHPQSDGSFCMSDCNLNTISLSDSADDTISVSCTLTKDFTATSYLKVFVWEKNTLTPYAQAIVLK